MRNGDFDILDVDPEFSGIMANPTYAKVMEGARIAREHQAGMILGAGKDADLKAIADSCMIVSGSYKKMTREEIFEIFKECR